MQFYINTTKFIIGITIISVILLTTLTILKYIPHEVFDTSAKLGDTMNIVAPFINVVAAILIIQSFREQQKSNDIQTQQYNFDRINNLIIELQESMQKMSITVDYENEDETRPVVGKSYRVVKVLHQHLSDENNNRNNTTYIKNINVFYTDILKLLKLITMISKSIQSNNLDNDSKDYLTFKLMEELRYYIQYLNTIASFKNLNKPYHISIRDNISRTLKYVWPLFPSYNFNDID